MSLVLRLQVVLACWLVASAILKSMDVLPNFCEDY